ncbi:GNAT family N-acetyltransferase [Vibrio sp. NH-7]
MDTENVMLAYNQYERQQFNALGGEKIDTPELVRFVSPERYGSYIAYFCLTAENAQAVIDREKAFFQRQGKCFEWKTYQTDKPDDIAQRLLNSGFEKAEQESFMVLDLSTITVKPVDESLLTEVHDEQGIRDAIRVQEQVWGGNFDWQFQHLLSLKQQTPDAISIYVVYHQGQPVTSAWLTFNGESPFAGIWGGSTIESERGKGFYSLLLNKRIAEAKSRGKQYLTIDASDMSKPIVEKYGFQFVTSTIGYEFNVE